MKSCIKVPIIIALAAIVVFLMSACGDTLPGGGTQQSVTLRIIVRNEAKNEITKFVVQYGVEAGKSTDDGDTTVFSHFPSGATKEMPAGISIMPGDAKELGTFTISNFLDNNGHFVFRLSVSVWDEREGSTSSETVNVLTAAWGYFDTEAPSTVIALRYDGTVDLKRN